MLNATNINIITHIQEMINFKLWDNKLEVYVKL